MGWPDRFYHCNAFQYTFYCVQLWYREDSTWEGHRKWYKHRNAYWPINWL